MGGERQAGKSSRSSGLHKLKSNVALWLFPAIAAELQRPGWQRAAPGLPGKRGVQLSPADSERELHEKRWFWKCGAHAAI